MRKDRLTRSSRGFLLLTLVVLWLAGEAGAQAPPRPEAQVARVQGIEMYYEVYGHGSPVVLLHGFTGSGHAWKPYIAAFTKHYRVIVPDLRGHGRSTNPTNRFTHRQSALDVFGLLDHLKISRFMGVGSSSGGMTLIHMATQQPGRVDAMVLLSSTTYFPDQARERMRQRTVDAMSPQAWEQLRRIHKHGDEQIRALMEQFHAFKDSHDDMSFAPAHLSTIAARTLIVHGDRDEFFPVSIPVEMYRAIPRSALWIVPNGGHNLFAKGGPSIMRAALEFLRGDWDKDGR